MYIYIIFFFKGRTQQEYFTFCKYAFIFDIEAKTKILKIDHIYQVCTYIVLIFDKSIRLEIIQLINIEFQVQQFTHLGTETPIDLRSPSLYREPQLLHDDYVVLTVSRQNLVESAIEGLSRFTEYDCKKPLKVSILIYLKNWAKKILLICIKKKNR